MRITTVVFVLLWLPAMLAAESFTVYDDGDPVYNSGVYSMGSSGRPASGSSYSGAVDLVCHGDLERYSASGWCRDPNRLAAFATNNTSLATNADWTVEMDVANDVVSPDMGFTAFIVDFKPTAATLNIDFATLLSHTLMWFFVGDQHPDEDDREGFRIESIGPGIDRQNITPTPRLDPVPDATGPGHNTVRIRWLAGTQTFEWTLSNANGTRTVTKSASQLNLHPSEVWLILGTPNPTWMAGAAWTIHSISLTSAGKDIGTKKQMFLDEWIIGGTSGIRRVLHQPTKYVGNPIVRPEYGWEACATDMNTVMYDEDERIYKMWYRAVPFVSSPGIGIGYATSADGVNWSKALGLEVMTDGDGFYRLSGSRPPSGSSYSGTTELACCAVPFQETARDAKWLSAIAASDVGLSHASDWWISFDVSNDQVSPDLGVSVFLVNYRPSSSTLNQSLDWVLARSTFWFTLGDQFPNDSTREGFRIEAMRAGLQRANITPTPRLDPDPDKTGSTGHNRVTIEWSAATKQYRWTIANKNGTRTVTEPASNLYLSNLSTTYFMIGTWNNTYLGSAWTLHDASYDQGQLGSTPPPGNDFTLYDDGGSVYQEHNNLVWRPMGDWYVQVMKESGEPNPAKRYKNVYWQLDGPPGNYGHATVFSPDGLHWTSVTQAASTQLKHCTGVFWDDRIGRYVAAIQYKTAPRTAGRQESADLIVWTPKVEVFTPDASDPPGTEFYCWNIYKEDDLYIAFIMVYHTDPNEPMPRKEGTIDVQLACSRDGWGWQRVGDRGIFIPLGPPGAFDDGMVFAGSRPVRVGDTLRLYYAGWDGTHAAWPRQGYVGLATLRADGYISLEPVDGSGTVTTKLVRFGGDELHVNADAVGGSLRVELVDPVGQPVAGFGSADCDPIITDSVDHLVTWRGRSQIPAMLAGVTVKFDLTAAKLYSFGFREAPQATHVESIYAAKELPDGALVELGGAVVTAAFDGFFYVENPDRSSGIRVVSPAPVTVGDTVTVTGILRTVSGEREILARDVR